MHPLTLIAMAVDPVCFFGTHHAAPEGPVCDVIMSSAPFGLQNSDSCLPPPAMHGTGAGTLLGNPGCRPGCWSQRNELETQSVSPLRGPLQKNKNKKSGNTILLFKILFSNI